MMKIPYQAWQEVYTAKIFQKVLKLIYPLLILENANFKKIYVCLNHGLK